MADNGGARRRAGRRGLWIVAGIAAAGAVAAVVGIWHLPDRMYPGVSDGAVQARAALQGGLLTAAAALTAVAGGLIALDETRQANAETQRANRDTHVRELYMEAVKLLNDAERGIRLAGIYALERIAVDSPADQRTVVEVLSAFVRDRTTGVMDSKPSTDVQAALTVLGRLPARPGVPRADLAGANIAGADLPRADFAGARLDHVVLVGARLGRANLTDARLGGADLTGARLGEANMSGTRMRGATLTGAWLRGTNLTHVSLVEVDLTDAWLGGANLTGAELYRANVTNTGLGGAILTAALGLSQEQVDVAQGDGWTRLPAGLVRPASWTSDDDSEA